MITVRRISFSEVLDAPNAQELLAEYAAECSLPELGPINPQRGAYAAMESSGAFQCFGVFSGGVLAGFASALAYAVPHYGRRIATVESLFVARAYRPGMAGRELMDAIECYAITMRCVAVLYSAPAGGQLEKLLMRQEPYRHSNTVFLRAL